MVKNQFCRGSEWRIWDLQVQTILDDGYVSLGSYADDLKSDYPDVWNEFVAKVGGEDNAIRFDSKEYFDDTAISEDERCINYCRTLFAFVETFRPNVGLIGVTDHNYSHPKLLDVFKQYAREAKLRALTGVEINACGVHMLVYFDDPPCQKLSISSGIVAFLDILKVNNAKTEGTLTVSEKSASEVLELAEAHDGLVVFPHCNSSNGLFQERGKTDRTHLANIYNKHDVIFLQASSSSAMEKTAEYVLSRPELFKAHPIFSISPDSRCLNDIGTADDSGAFFWVKANPTYKGLRQVYIEPSRAFIGEEPDLHKRVRSDSNKFIKGLRISKVEESELDDIWFDEFSVEFNSGLVAVIGNKGSGKSALTDIISLCSDTKQASNFSFLTPEKFRKKLPVNLSERFTATLEWEDGSATSHPLSHDPNSFADEKVKYIPQNFLEQVCAKVESDEFEKEIKKIIFSHTPHQLRLGKDTLDELIDYRSDVVLDEVAVINNEISKLNGEICALEEKQKQDFKMNLEERLRSKKAEFGSHQARRPVRPPEVPMQESQENDPLESIRAGIFQLEGEQRVAQERQAKLNIHKVQLEKAIQIFENLENEILRHTGDDSEVGAILKEHQLELTAIFSYSLNTGPLLSIVESINTELQGTDEQLSPATPSGLAFKLAELNSELAAEQEKLSRPAREEQRYLNELKDWSQKERELVGTADIEGSIQWLENQIQYIEKQIPELVRVKKSDRRVLLERLYEKKIELREIRRDLFRPLTNYIDDLADLKEKYDVRVDVGLELDGFTERFFSIISQGRIGSFCGKEEGLKHLRGIIESISFEDKDGFISFSEMIVESLERDKRSRDEPEIDIESQIRKGFDKRGLLDFLFQYEYLKPVYQLKMGEKELQSLSPGERGALLLIFYLILDRDDTPLIIDQPEENLDNESVYYILVHFIKQVKERRQIFIVTHNPNLAIVCDADQIIEMQIEKEYKNRVSCKSGAIEDESMNTAAVNILEGTLAALNNRYAKYHKQKDATRQ